MNEEQFAKLSSLIEKSLLSNRKCDKKQGGEFTPATYLIDMIAILIDEDLITRELDDIIDSIADFKAEVDV